MADATPDGYASELRREIMRSEIQRVRVLAIILAVLLVATLAATNLFLDFSARMFRGGIAGWVPLAGFGPFLLYELVVLFVLRWRAAKDRDFPRLGALRQRPDRDQPAQRHHPHALPPHGPVDGVRLLAADALFRVHPAVDAAARFLAVAVDRRGGGGRAARARGLAAAAGGIRRGSRAHAEYHFSRSIVLLGAGVVAGIVAGSLRRQFEKSVAAAAARDRVTNLFGQHVSPAVVDRLLATQTDPPSEMREVCVLFLDIRGFTAMTRMRPADQTVSLLNDFFAEMIDIVDRHNGIINKFLGDGFLALFGAPLEDPKAAANALAAARAMLDAVDDWNRDRPDRTLRVGIGINIGEAVTGTVGSPHRKEYTVIGDTVNLAARLEQLTKETGSRLLVSSSVHEATTGADGATDLGALKIRGYDKDVRVWRVA